jgi:hypothetical protein
MRKDVKKAAEFVQRAVELVRKGTSKSSTPQVIKDKADEVTVQLEAAQAELTKMSTFYGNY